MGTSGIEVPVIMIIKNSKIIYYHPNQDHAHLSKVTLHLSEEAARSIIIFSTAYFVVPYGFVQLPVRMGNAGLVKFKEMVQKVCHLGKPGGLVIEEQKVKPLHIHVSKRSQKGSKSGYFCHKNGTKNLFGIWINACSVFLIQR